MDPHTLALARRIYDYHQLRQRPVAAEWMLVFGTNDLRVAAFAAELFAQRLAPRLICSGGCAHLGDLLATGWSRSEAEMFAAVAVEHGVPPERIQLEPRALNTAENIRFTRQLLAAEGDAPTRLLLVCKPFMQRRVAATMAVEWPEMPFSVASPALSLEAYFTPGLPAEKIVPILMGDLQRLWLYARKGWSAPQRVPAEVMEAYHELAALGFTQHLLPEE